MKPFQASPDETIEELFQNSSTVILLNVLRKRFRELHKSFSRSLQNLREELLEQRIKRFIDILRKILIKFEKLA